MMQDLATGKKKISFIICTNNDRMLDECGYYIDRLVVPEGKSIDIIPVRDAYSICGGYNIGMAQSDAEYKIYIHQDVFILNEYFLVEMLKAFESDHEYGLLGVIGCDRIPTNASCWNSWNIGTTYSVDSEAKKISRLKHIEGLVCQAEAIDGMIMMTRKDILWREDIFDGWDFYDISQSLEFQRYGYKVGVIMQDKPWCVHDCGLSKLVRYDHYREIFCNNYDGFEYDNAPSESDAKIELGVLAGKIVETIDGLLISGQINLAYSLLDQCSDKRGYDNRLNTLLTAYEICCAGDDENQLNKLGKSVNEIIDSVNELKFILRRCTVGDAKAQEYIRNEVRTGNLNNGMIAVLERRYL